MFRVLWFLMLLRSVLPFASVCLSLALAGRLSSASPATLPRTPPEMQPFASAVDYARSRGLPTDIMLAPSEAAPLSGDEVIYLLGLQQAHGVSQWLVRLTVGRSDTATRLPDDVLYTSTGRELCYTHTPATLEVEFVGPFTAEPAAAPPLSVQHGRTVVSAESLQLGMVRYCETSLGVAERLKKAGIDRPVFFGGDRPPTPEALAAGRKAAAAFGLTADEERLAFSVYFALRAFYQAATEIPACRAVIEQVIQKPSLWSVAGNLGVNTNFEYGWQKVQLLPAGQFAVAAPVYLLPVRLSLNDRPALQAGLAVTTTQPPLRNCAGIVAMALQHPTDFNRRAFLRVLGARAAAH